MPRYMLLINNDGEAPPPTSEEEAQAEMAKWFQYTDDLRDAGVHVAGEALHVGEPGSRVHRDTGTVTDGPFAEVKEVVGGFYLLEVADEDAAVAWAGKMPGSGTVDVVPCVDFEQ